MFFVFTYIIRLTFLKTRQVFHIYFKKVYVPYHFNQIVNFKKLICLLVTRPYSSTNARKDSKVPNPRYRTSIRTIFSFLNTKKKGLTDISDMD